MIGSFLTVLMGIQLVLFARVSFLNPTRSSLEEKAEAQKGQVCPSRSQDRDGALQCALVKVTLLMKRI